MNTTVKIFILICFFGLISCISNKHQETYYSQIVLDHILGNEPNQISYEITESETPSLEIISFIDSTSHSDTARNCFEIESILFGDINIDSKEDFAAKVIWNPCMGNSFGINWYIFVSENDKYIQITNHFGGGKFSDIENIVSLKDNQITTTLHRLNQQSLLHNDLTDTLHYELNGNQLFLANSKKFD